MNGRMLTRAVIERAVRIALEEDLGRGDITTAACVPSEQRTVAELRARQALVVCGLEVAREAFEQVDPELRFATSLADGARAGAGAVLASVEGAAASILGAERVALNFMQRLSAVATRTRELVEALPSGSRTRITDTRKTTPGLRALERHAVRAGGGHNHREDLSSAVLIKDNHVAACGGVRQAIERARAHAPHTSRICCEVDRLDQLEEALTAGADCVLLDNFDDESVGAAVKRVAGRALVEVSGNVSLARIANLARLGVDAISVGAITHSAGSVDIGLDFTASS